MRNIGVGGRAISLSGLGGSAPYASCCSDFNGFSAILLYSGVLLCNTLTHTHTHRLYAVYNGFKGFVLSMELYKHSGDKMKH